MKQFNKPRRSKFVATKFDENGKPWMWRSFINSKQYKHVFIVDMEDYFTVEVSQDGEFTELYRYTIIEESETNAIENRIATRAEKAAALRSCKCWIGANLNV